MGRGERLSEKGSAAEADHNQADDTGNSQSGHHKDGYQGKFGFAVLRCLPLLRAGRGSGLLLIGRGGLGRFGCRRGIRFLGLLGISIGTAAVTGITGAAALGARGALVRTTSICAVFSWASLSESLVTVTVSDGWEGVSGLGVAEAAGVSGSREASPLEEK